MPKTTLFETLTGYKPTAKPKQLLGASGAQNGAADEHREEEFPSILADLEAQLAEGSPQAEETARKLADAFGVNPDVKYLRERVREAREIVAESRKPKLLGAKGTAKLDYEAKYAPRLLGLPKNFSRAYVDEHVVERYRKPYIDLEPKQTRFEDDNILGILGWLALNGLEAVKVPRHKGVERFGEIKDAEPFIRHTASDPFVYPLAAGGDGRTRVALFADFGTGLAHSRYIARQIATDRYDAAVHLGDVYYTGTDKQYEEYFIEPMNPVLANGTKLFVIPDNHDGYSGFHAYVKYIRRPELPQGGSYFAIEAPHVQFIGCDTIWHGDRGRIEDPGLRAWLKERFAAGRAAKRANVLLTGHEPYELGKKNITDLNEDVCTLTDGALDLWFWGNTHYCALFDRADKTPYYGSCIGHAGYPYKRRTDDEKKKTPASVLFLETGLRYEPEDVRERGMNGYCSFEIEAGGEMLLRYIDWRGHDRCRVRFTQQQDGALVLAQLEDLVHGT